MSGQTKPISETSRRRRVSDPPPSVVIPFETDITREDIRDLIDCIKETNKSLSSVAHSATESLGFLRRIFKVYTPWLIAAASVIWPVLGKIVQQVPLPHL